MTTEIDVTATSLDIFVQPNNTAVKISGGSGLLVSDTFAQSGAPQPLNGTWSLQGATQ